MFDTYVSYSTEDVLIQTISSSAYVRKLSTVQRQNLSRPS